MSDFAIKVENLSKRYRIGAKEEQHDTLSGAMAAWLKAPFSNFRRIKKLTDFTGKNDDENTLWALKDVSLEIKQGEVVGVIGRNGAGKSTLLKILSRITDPTDGQVQVRGRVASLLEVGTGFHNELTGRENVFLNGTILGMTREEVNTKFNEIVAFSGVERFLDTPVKFYSSGMRVRLAFSVAAHLEPEILLVDEVLAVGDLNFQQKCLSHMKKLTESGMTIMLVSHNMMAIQSSCERVYLMNQGEVAASGKPLPVIERYREVLAEEIDGAPSHAGSIKADNTDSGVSILNFEMFGEEGVPKRDFRFGERVKIRFELFSKERIEYPYINFGIVRGDRVIITNFSNYYDNFRVDYIEGKCVLEGWLPPLRLVPNYYEIHVVIWPWGGAHKGGDVTHAVPLAHKTYDNFRVSGTGLNSADGVFQLPATKWEFHRDGETIAFTDIKDENIFDVFDDHDKELGGDE